MRMLHEVYPRVGGATSLLRDDIACINGLSPRGRGNPAAKVGGLMPDRSIPAWAGQPRPRGPPGWRPTVYPRVGGATHVAALGQLALHGLSPRGRGNRAGQPVPLVERRSIPAWAGQPRGWPPAGETGRVYPRVGGATAPGHRWPRRGDGLSPRGRGNLEHPHPGEQRRGSIPAWAGQPLVVSLRLESVTGLSPRGRGNPLLTNTKRPFMRSIPAWAGQPRLAAGALHGPTVYPRVGGATWVELARYGWVHGLSPRGRGNHLPDIGRE